MFGYNNAANKNINMESVIKLKVSQIIAEHLGVSVSEIVESDTLADMGADSLDFVQICYEIQEIFSIKFSDDSDTTGNIKVSDLVEKVSELVAKKGWCTPFYFKKFFKMIFAVSSGVLSHVSITKS